MGYSIFTKKSRQTDNRYHILLHLEGISMKKGIISVVSALAGAAIGAGAVGKVTGGDLEKAKAMSDKHFVLFRMMDQWVQVKQEGKNLASYFEKNGYQKIAIYGMSFAGKTLINELKGTKVTVAYGIDKNADAIYTDADIDIVSMDEELEKVDAIVVTAVTFFDEIEEMLAEKTDCPILSLEDILYEV